MNSSVDVGHALLEKAQSLCRKNTALRAALSLLAGSAFLMSLLSCKSRYVVPETPMPPHTVLLSQMMRELSSQPGFPENVLEHLGKGPKQGPAFLTPRLMDDLRKRILGKDWQGLDRFPAWDMPEITAGVGALNRIDAIRDTSRDPSRSTAMSFFDIGEYSLDKAQTLSLDIPSNLPPFTSNGIVVPLGVTITRGDGPNSLAAEHPESQRLANVLNRLAANRLEDAKPFVATLRGKAASSPEELIRIFADAGFEIEIDDTRYFANFGHLHDKGEDVMMPFWLNTKIAVPGTGGLFRAGRSLLVPVSHAEYELHIRKDTQPYADLEYYFGIDGKSEWRTMDTLDQAWVLKRNAHEYRGEQAIEVTRLTTLLTLAYLHQHETRPSLPFGGYFTLGVCQDGVSAIEQKMTGAVTLFPNTADDSLFDDPRDAEVNAMMKAIPKDRENKAPEPERIFGSLPTSDLSQITIPGLSHDLEEVYAAWKSGKLRRMD